MSSRRFRCAAAPLDGFVELREEIEAADRERDSPAIGDAEQAALVADDREIHEALRLVETARAADATDDAGGDCRPRSHRTGRRA